MEISEKEIFYKQRNESYNSFRELKDEIELTRKFIESSYISLEPIFGPPEEANGEASIVVRGDVEANITCSLMHSLGGNKSLPAFLHAYNINNTKNKITIMVCVQPQEVCRKHRNKITEYIYNFLNKK